MRLDDRDGDVAEGLDALVRDVQPRDEGARSVRRKGSRRRAARWTAIGVAVIVFAGGAPAAGLLLRDRPRHTIQGQTQWSTYLFKVTRGQGYLVGHPSTWEVQPLEAACGDWRGPAVFLSNVHFQFKAISGPTSCGDQWDFRGLPARAVAIDLDPMVVGPAVPPGFRTTQPPTRFPISFDDRAPSPAPAPTPAGGPISFRPWEIPLKVHGAIEYRIRIFIGPEASPSDRAFARMVVGSIRPVLLGGQFDPGPSLQALPDHGPVGTKVLVTGSGFDPTLARDENMLFGMWRDFPDGCELITGGINGTIHVHVDRGGNLRGSFVLEGTGVCKQRYGRRIPVRPGVHQIFVGCMACGAGTFRVTPG